MNKEESRKLVMALEAAGVEYQRLTTSVLKKANELAGMWPLIMADTLKEIEKINQDMKAIE